ncbi:MAG: NYN domain-containing protein [Candidatus Omnitrophica bacterium]|nr:NYN domain-containing protein [Candidatus Omnitrophota bacterium]
MVTGRVVFLIDGFNIYHSLREDPRLRQYKWLDLYKLCSILIPRRCQITKVYYCSAYVTWDSEKMLRHQQYVRLLKTTPIDVVLGKFKEKSVRCRLCRQAFKTSIEKETDVNIAIKLLQGGIQDIYDSAGIVSGDSDLVPAIRGVKEAFPTKQIGVAFPIGRVSKDLRQVADFSMKLHEYHLRTCQFPDRVDLGGGFVLQRPATWRA